MTTELFRPELRVRGLPAAPVTQEKRVSLQASGNKHPCQNLDFGLRRPDL